MACDARDGSLRYRQKGTNGVHQPPWNGVLQDGGSYVTSQANGQRLPLTRHQKRLLGLTFYACLLVFYLGTALLVRRLQLSLPDAVSTDPADDGRVFVGARARQRLAQLVAIGQRTVGSVENEVIAVDYLMRELEQLRKRARPAHKLEFVVQKPNGSFFLDFIDGFTSSYRGIQNVIARLAPRDPPPAVDQRHSLLVNCHYDTAPGSPGKPRDASPQSRSIRSVLSPPALPCRHPNVLASDSDERARSRTTPCSLIGWPKENIQGLAVRVVQRGAPGGAVRQLFRGTTKRFDFPGVCFCMDVKYRHVRLCRRQRGT